MKRNKKEVFKRPFKKKTTANIILYGEIVKYKCFSPKMRNKEKMSTLSICIQLNVKNCEGSVILPYLKAKKLPQFFE